MALSNFWTVEKVWDEVQRDLAVPVNSEAFAQRVSIIDRAQKYIIGLFYDLVGQIYMRRDTSLSVASTTVQADDINVASAAYVASTKTLNTQIPGLSSADIGKTAIFWTASGSYMGGIVSVSTTYVVLSGNNLPAATINAPSILGVVIIPTAVLTTTFSLATYDMAAAGQQIRLDVESTATKDVRELSLPELKKFDPTSQGNRKTIGFALQGKTLFLVKGSDLTNFGTLTIWYPGLPITVTSLSSYVDLPDGASVELAILYAKKLVRERLGMPPAQETGEIERSVRSFYNTFRAEADAQEIEEKIRALK